MTQELYSVVLLGVFGASVLGHLCGAAIAGWRRRRAHDPNRRRGPAEWQRTRRFPHRR